MTDSPSAASAASAASVDVRNSPVHFTGEILKVDTEGRVVLTESVKAYAGIKAEVTFVGQGHKFQIWEPGRFRAHLDEARSRVRDLRKQLSARYTTERS